MNNEFDEELEELEELENYDSNSFNNNKNLKKEFLKNQIKTKTDQIRQQRNNVNHNQNATNRLKQRNANTLGKKVESRNSTSSNNEGNNLDKNDNNENKNTKLNPLDKLRQTGKNVTKKATDATKDAAKKAGKAVANGITTGIKALALNPATAPFFWTGVIVLILIILIPILWAAYDSSSDDSGSGQSGLVCSYNVNGNEYSDIKVRLLQCGDGSRGKPIAGEELVDFEKYILGVVYAENNVNEHASKAQAIAARSYALTRGKAMGGAFNLGIVEEKGQKILQIRNCTEDQVYCDPDVGCWSNNRYNNTTVHSGAVSGKVFSKAPLAADDPLRQWVKDTAGMTVKDSSGNTLYTTYRDIHTGGCNCGTCMSQVEAANLGKSGYDFNQILMHEYGKLDLGLTTGKNCEYVNNGDSIFASSDFIWPINATQIISIFGYRGAVSGGSSWHDAIDIPDAMGTPIHAIGDGEVAAIYFPGSYNAVYVYHGTINGQKIFARYEHGDVLVSVGQRVKKGDIIGKVAGWGPSGRNSYGSHLDFSATVLPADVDNSQVRAYRRVNPLITLYNIKYDGESDGQTAVSIKRADGSTINRITWNTARKEQLNLKSNWCTNNSGPCGFNDRVFSPSDY